MADAAARREARRAKILASGQDRLNKLTSTFTGKPVETTLPAPQSHHEHQPTPTLTADDSAQAASTHVPPTATPPPTLNPQVRQRVGDHIRAAPQSPSVARTPMRGHSTVSEYMNDSMFDPSSTATSNEADLFGGLGGSGGGMFEAQQELSALQKKLKMAFQQPEFLQSQQQEEQQEPLPQQRWTVLGLVRALTMCALALFTLYGLADAANDVVDFEDDDIDWMDAPEWKMTARRVGSLATTPIAEGGGQLLQLGENMYASAWMLFVTVELVLQTVGFAMRAIRPTPRPASQGRELLEMAQQLVSNPKLDFLIRSINDYSSIWQSFVQDMFTFVFVLGAGVAVALLISK
ncbi:hypothetical protein DFJ77DRAFT_68585 [Powellomyces hirtus]|nr:hypothetical protein DFJ77DRAFT_68585 [Powellomyces hirtus]